MSKKFKSCTRCGTTYPLEHYYKQTNAKDGRYPRCRPCHRDEHLLREYGISHNAFLNLLSMQNNLCAICGKPQTGGKLLFVDHDHTTGKVRGLLCTKCNTALGLLHEDSETILNLLAYVRQHEVLP